MKTIEARGQYPMIEYQNSFRYSGVEWESMRRTPIAAGIGVGSVLENLNAKVDVRYRPEEVAVQRDLSPDEQRKRIEALHRPFNKAVCRVIGTIARKETDDSEIVRSLARIRELKSQILSGEIISGETPDND